MIRIFATSTPVEGANITMTAPPIIISILEEGILEPGILN